MDNTTDGALKEPPSEEAVSAALLITYAPLCHPFNKARKLEVIEKMGRNDNSLGLVTEPDGSSVITAEQDRCEALGESWPANVPAPRN